MAGVGLNQILDDMDATMLDQYNEYATVAVESWVTFRGTAGQNALVKKYIIPAAQEHALNARPNWPESDTPDDFTVAMYDCYDSDVMAKAFSDTIEQIYSDLYELWAQSVDIQNEHAFIVSAAGSGDNAGPHSTHAVWRG